MKLEKPEEKEMEMLLEEIPHATSTHPNPTHNRGDVRATGGCADGARRPFLTRHDVYGGGAPDSIALGRRHGNALLSDAPSSASGSVPGGLSPAGRDGRRRSPESARRPDSLADEERRLAGGELSLLERLRATMHVRDDGGEAAIGRVGDNPSLLRNGGAAVMRPLEEDAPVFPRSVLPDSGFNHERFSPTLNSLEPWLSPQMSDAVPYMEDGVFNGFQANGGPGGNSYLRGLHYDNVVSPLDRPWTAETFLQPQQSGFDLNGNLGSMGSPGRPHAALPMLHYGSLLLGGRAEASPNGWARQPLSPARSLRNIKAFDCEDGLIIQGKGLRLVGSNRRELQRELKRSQLDERLHTRGGSALDMGGVRGSPRLHSSPALPPGYDNLIPAELYIYHMAKDQNGCRFLQRKLNEGKPHEVAVIFNGIADRVVELMTNPFGNYLMQKLLDVCSEEQRMRIILVLTKDPAELVRISLNGHGTRAVQKLIQTLITQQQISLVMTALKPGFLDLIKDLNGNHVVQRCLQTLSPEDNKFIFDAASKHCVDIATHQHGCCVLQRCIAHSTGEHRANMVAEIAANGLFLAQDAFGNYVVQYILELKNPSATANLVSQFEGHYVNLSTQKFSSNVVEKCLNVFGEAPRARIIAELLSVSRFEQLLQDPYANYVIQSALANSKGSLHAALVEAIRPHAAVLRTSPYSKRIFSRTLLKK